jgi:hypothetical protein
VRKLEEEQQRLTQLRAMLEQELRSPTMAVWLNVELATSTNEFATTTPVIIRLFSPGQAKMLPSQ